MEREIYREIGDVIGEMRDIFEYVSELPLHHIHLIIILRPHFRHCPISVIKFWFFKLMVQNGKEKKITHTYICTDTDFIDSCVHPLDNETEVPVNH